MSSERGKKRSKAFYRKSAFGAKRQCTTGANRLEAGQRGFLIMCNNNESSAVREAYNILNDFADQMFGQGKTGNEAVDTTQENTPQESKAVGTTAAEHIDSDEDSEDEDIEKALKKEVDSMKSQPSQERRFQNCATKAKNCVFIRSTVTDPVKLAVSIMEDIAHKKESRARYAAKILPVVGTCKAHTSDIEQLAKTELSPMFSPENPKAPKSFTVLFKTRNNNTTTCGKTSVIPAVTKVIKEINPDVAFSWSDYETAILVEIVCTVCCLGVAPGFARLRKYNLQELLQGEKVAGNDRGQTVEGGDEREMVEDSEQSKEPESTVEEEENKLMSDSIKEPSVEAQENRLITDTDSVDIEEQVSGRNETDSKIKKSDSDSPDDLKDENLLCAESGDRKAVLGNVEKTCASESTCSEDNKEKIE